MPQALRHVIPGLVNSFIALFKDTSLVSIVALFDLLGQLAGLVLRSGLVDADDAVHRLCLHRNHLFRLLLWHVALFAVRREPAERAPPQLSKSTMTANSIVSITGLNKWYGDFHVLRDINLDVAKGERIVICGPSGSGKSTLIRCINALEEFQEGEIVVDGIELGSESAAGRRSPARSRHGVPELQSVSASDRAGELHAGADLGAQHPEEGCRSGRDEISWSGSRSRIRPTNIRARCRAASSSASRSPAR